MLWYSYPPDLNPEIMPSLADQGLSLLFLFYGACVSAAFEFLPVQSHASYVKVIFRYQKTVDEVA